MRSRAAAVALALRAYAPSASQRPARVAPTSTLGLGNSNQTDRERPVVEFGPHRNGHVAVLVTLALGASFLARCSRVHNRRTQRSQRGAASSGVIPTTFLKASSPVLSLAALSRHP